MARVPKLHWHISSTNLTPDRPVTFKIHASTHHWRGQLLDTWASADIDYISAHQTANACAFLREELLTMQEFTEPAQDIRIRFPHPEGNQLILLSNEDKDYYDAVKLATDKGWMWSEDFSENLLTGERKTMGGTRPYNISLSTWEWGGMKLGGSVAFPHFQREDESKAELLRRILETSEKAKKDFPDSIPYTDIYGQIKVDNFKTRIVFNS